MFEAIILLIAGIGAGIVTGLVGASAVVFSAPLLIMFLGYSPYSAIAFSLATDVVASIVATIIYHRNKNLRLKESLFLLLSALIGVVAGSFISLGIPSKTLGIATGIGIALAGLGIYKRKTQNKSKEVIIFRKNRGFFIVLFGLIIGLIAGIFGAGGGIMILLVLVLVLNYKTHQAIGTSVLLMIFIALFGATAHFINIEFSLLNLFILSFGALFGSLFAARYANKIDEKKLNRIVGVIVIVIGLTSTMNQLI
ncbi:TSUP family transporter [Candidatus Pacearchaeota archaeon]|nr:TSUP family transporter [Candidatus Pacearchaeota archaeon]